MRKGIICDGNEQEKTYEQCRKCALRGNMICDRNPAIILSTLDRVEEYIPTERDRPSLSVTTLTSICKRQVDIKEKFDYWENPSKMNYIWRGGIVHELLEKVENKNWLKEKKIVIPWSIKVGKENVEVYIVMKPDVIDIVLKYIYDYKTTGSVFKSTRTISDGYKKQLGVYRWGVKKSELDILIKKYFDAFIDMKQDKQVNIPLMPFIEVEKFIQEQGSILLDAMLNNKVPSVLSKFPTYWMCQEYCPVNHICAKLYYEEGKK